MNNEPTQDPRFFKHQKEFERYMARPKEKVTIEDFPDGTSILTKTWWCTDTEKLVTGRIHFVRKEKK